MYKIADMANGVLPGAGEYTTEAEAEQALKSFVDEQIDEQIDAQTSILLDLADQYDEGRRWSPAEEAYPYIVRVAGADDREREATRCAEEMIREFFRVVEDD